MSGNRIRRVPWTDRWLRFYNGLWWVMPATGNPRVVTTADFSAEDFKALDWTHFSASCLAQIHETDPRFPTCPLPYQPPAPPAPPASSGSSGSSGSSVTGPRGPQGVPSFPPAEAAEGGGEGSHGGGPGKGPVPDPRPNPPGNISWPGIILEASTPVECLVNDGTGMASFIIAGSVTLGAPIDPRAKANYYFVTVKIGQKVKSFLMPAGDTQFFDATAGPVNIAQGSISVTATAVMAHGDGTTISAPAVQIPVPAPCLFPGFNSIYNPSLPSGSYDHLAIFDWDECLMSSGITDSFSGGGRSFVSYPWPGYSFSYDVGNGTYATYERPANVVDGHSVWKANGDGTATCISGTGAYGFHVGWVVSISEILSWVAMPLGDHRVDDQLRYGCGPGFQPSCCEGATEDIPFAFLWNES